MSTYLQKSSHFFSQKIISCLVLTASILGAAPALATHYSGYRTYFVQYHFSGFAYGKTVKSVMVHTAALTKDCEGREYWENTRDIFMDQRNGYFNARAVVGGNANNACPSAQGLVVQYWVTFVDGSTMITPSSVVPSEDLGTFSDIDDSATPAFEKASRALSQEPDAMQTMARFIQTGHAS